MIHPNTRAFNAEIALWESVGALSWPTKDFLAIFASPPIYREIARKFKLSNR